MKRCKLLLAMIGAVVLLGALVGSASARNLSLSNQTFRVMFRSVNFTAPFGEVRCRLTLEGSFHSRTLAKVAGSLVGYITRADLGFCEIGTATILRETLPWHVRYSSFAGVLPNITSIRFATETRFRIREPLAACLFASTPERPATLTFSRDVASRVLTTAERGGTVPSNCLGAEGTLSSTRDSVTALNSTTRITVTLI